jgi:hypothetical protein
MTWFSWARAWKPSPLNPLVSCVKKKRKRKEKGDIKRGISRSATAEAVKVVDVHGLFTVRRCAPIVRLKEAVEASTRFVWLPLPLAHLDYWLS